MPRRLALALALAAVLAPAAHAGPGDETVTARADALRTGHVGGSGLQPPLRLRWQADLGQVGGPPLVFGGRVVYLRLPGTGRFLTALSAADGRTLWDVRLPTQSGSVDLATDQGRVFVANAEWLYAYDAATGGELWRKRFEEGYPEGYASSFVVGRDGVVYAIRDVGVATLYALRAADGGELWRAPLISGTGAGPTVDGTTVYVVQGAGVVQAFDRATGAERWAYRTCCTGGGGGFGVRHGGVLLQNEAGPRVHDVRTGEVVGGFTGGLPFVTADGFVHPLGNGIRTTAHDGTPRWAWSPDPYASIGVAATTPSSVVATVENQAIATLDVRTGERTWCAAPVAPPGSETFPALGGIAAGQGLLVVGYGHGLFAYENGGAGSGCAPLDPPPPTPIPVAPSSASPALSLAAGRTDLVLGERTRIGGAITGVANAGGREVVVQVDEHPFGTWRSAHRTRTAADGTFRAMYTPRRNARLRAVAGDLVSPPVTVYADFPGRMRVLGAGTARPRLRVEVGALPGAQIRKRRVVFYLARRGQAQLRRVGVRRWQVRARRFVRTTMPYPRGSLRRTDRWLACTREPDGGDGFGRPTPLDTRCGARRLPLPR